jgi:signal transduction histidine kinase
MLRSPFFSLFIFIFLISCQEKIKEIPKTNKVSKEALAYQKKALHYLETNHFNKAFYYFNQSKVAAEAMRDSNKIVYNLIQMAAIQQINGDYYGSKETLTEALPYIKKKDLYSAAINNYFGIANKELFIYDDAVYYYKEAIKDCEDEIAKNGPLNNIAVVYIQQKKYTKAIEILNTIANKAILNQKSLKSNKARILDNLGYAYFKNGSIKNGLLLMNEGFALRNQIDDSYGIIESNLHLSEYYQKIDANKSNQFALQAYQTATKFKSIDERLRALSFLITNSTTIKNTKYAQKFIFLNDSIIKVRNNFKNKFAKIKYDSKKEKIENRILRLEKAQNLLMLQKIKYQRLLFFIGTILLIIILLLLVRYYSIKTKTEKIKASYDTETRIAKKIHDELANDVYHTITFAQTQPIESEQTKENLLQQLDNIYMRVRGISRENNEIDTGINYAQNVKDTIATYNDSSRNVIVNNIEKVNWSLIDDTKKVTLYRVLQELMVNMKKHSMASLVVIKFDVSNPKFLEISYVDNGKGCVATEIIKNGLQNMENRITTINGTIIFDTAPDKGFKVKITLPN